MYGTLVHHNKTIPAGARVVEQEEVELTLGPHGG